ncbi:MAG: tripartite tricarboxylate transporter TctB family protein, partial [Proteobacteria bacterium]|nr:tripartite tricarboxylate transporter TctB family protein [Pseudomonadota bacterium]
LYLALLPYLGFITASFLYMSVTLMIIKVSWLRSMAYSLIAVACYHLIFAELLGIRLPREFFM